MNPIREHDTLFTRRQLLFKGAQGLGGFALALSSARISRTQPQPRPLLMLAAF